MRLILGNTAPMHAPKAKPGDTDPELVPVPKFTGECPTIVEFPDEVGMREAFMTVTLGGGIVDKHFAPGAAPSWVWSDHAGLASLLADEYGCEIRDDEPEI